MLRTPFARQGSRGNTEAWNDGEVATYVAFLRGVNLGPNNKIPMPALRAMAEDLGYTDVGTYINSGNLREDINSNLVYRIGYKNFGHFFGG